MGGEQQPYHDALPMDRHRLAPCHANRKPHTANLALNQSASAINGIQLRNVSTASNVPEPGSIALIGLGVIGLVTRRRKSA